MPSNSSQINTVVELLGDAPGLQEELAAQEIRKQTRIQQDEAERHARKERQTALPEWTRNSGIDPDPESPYTPPYSTKPWH